MHRRAPPLQSSLWGGGSPGVGVPRRLLRTGLFHLRRGRLSAAHGETHRQLETAIDAARHSVSKPGHGRVTSLIVRREASDAFEIIDVVGLPKARYAFGFEPRVLVVVRGAERDPDEIERLLQAAYGLTAEQVPLLKLSPQNWDAPFAPFA